MLLYKNKKKIIKEKLKIKSSETTNYGMISELLYAPAGIRTPDTLLKRQVLCLLSYWGASV